MRAEKVKFWKTVVTTQLSATRLAVIDWWHWCNSTADMVYHQSVSSPPLGRNEICVGATVPRYYQTIESGFSPIYLVAVPDRIKEDAMLRRSWGTPIRVVDLIFKLLQLIKPGSLEEKDTMLKQLNSPNPCVQPTSASKELRRWFTALERCAALGYHFLDMLYRGARSIYSSIFDNTDCFHSNYGGQH